MKTVNKIWSNYMQQHQLQENAHVCATWERGVSFVNQSQSKVKQTCSDWNFSSFANEGQYIGS